MSNIKLFYPADPVYKKPKVDQAELDRHKAEFLKSGGKIDHVPDGMVADRQKSRKELDHANWELVKDKENTQIQKIVDTRRQSQHDRSEAEKRARRQAQRRV
jgi:hypothetical protein